MRPSTSQPEDSQACETVDRVMCASHAASTEGVFAQMEKIRAAALDSHAGSGVHAMLLYQSGWFVYWVEGPSPGIRSFLDSVARLQHHRSRSLIHHSRGPRFLQTEWSMVMSPLSERPGAFGERVQRLRQYLLQGVQFAPTSVARRLSTPMRLPEVRDRPDPEQFHRVGVCSAAGDHAFALVRHLGTEQDQPVYGRRFTGKDDADSASDYVDFMHLGEPCRVIAVSRNGLAHGVRRAFLPDWPHLLLLLSGRPANDEALLQRLAGSRMGLPRFPALLGVAPDEATHAAAAALAKGLGLAYTPAGLAPVGDLNAAWQALAAILAQSGPAASSMWDLPGELAAA